MLAISFGSDERRADELVGGTGSATVESEWRHEAAGVSHGTKVAQTQFRAVGAF
jgi:hypothetical protein